MSKLKNILLVGLSMILVAALSIGGTLAYLQDDDSAVNVMTLGNVKIEQIEQERGADGKLQPFTQAKPAYPVVGTIDWATDGVEVNGEEYKVFVPELKNVVDKIVTVNNVGKTDAYVRTLVAIEAPDYDSENNIHINWNGTDVTITDTINIEIKGVDYVIFVFTYKEALAAGAKSAPSLVQLFLDEKADNDYCAEFGKTWDVLVLSQAVQAAGFADAKTALDTAFGTPSAKAAEWFGGVLAVGGAAKFEFETNTDPEAVKVSGTDKAAVLAAINAANPGDTIVLTENTTISGYAATNKLVVDKEITIDLNGHTLTTESGWGGIDLKGGASIVNGTINHTGNTAAIKAFQVGKIENVVINVSETAGKVKGGIVLQEGAGCYIGSIKNVVINGATNGIETYRCGDRTDLAIGSIENVTINAIDTGILLSAPIGKVENCTIKGANIGVNAYLYGPYSVTAEFVNCIIEGASADIYAHDEVGKTNPGSMTITYDAKMALDLDVVVEIEDEVADRVTVSAK